MSNVTVNVIYLTQVVFDIHTSFFDLFDQTAQIFVTLLGSIECFSEDIMSVLGSPVEQVIEIDQNSLIIISDWDLEILSINCLTRSSKLTCDCIYLWLGVQHCLEPVTLLCKVMALLRTLRIKSMPSLTKIDSKLVFIWEVVSPIICLPVLSVPAPSLIHSARVASPPALVMFGPELSFFIALPGSDFQLTAVQSFQFAANLRLFFVLTDSYQWLASVWTCAAQNELPALR